MIINKLTVMDFQVFQGRHEFDLQPRKKYGTKRPVILFGGMNGAGKTTTLTAIRLVLYGRQSLGRMVSQKAYEEYLEACIHSAKDTIIQANSASIELEFTYAKLGELKTYKVARFWTKHGKKLTEKLKIIEDDVELSELSKEQCQGFLNELVPVGVSELFFFDGEKIKELAEDDTGNILGDSIKRLLGLDTFDTLYADLGIYLRTASKGQASISLKGEQEDLEAQLAKLEGEGEKELFNIEQIKIKIADLESNIRRSENKLSEQGGAWAVSREKEIENQTALSASKDALAAQLHDLLAGSYPLSIAEEHIEKTLDQLEKENQFKKNTVTAKAVSERLESAEKNLRNMVIDQNARRWSGWVRWSGRKFGLTDVKKITKLLADEFAPLTVLNTDIEVVHDKSDSEFERIKSAFQDACKGQRKSAKDLNKQLSEIREQLDKAGKNIARAPLEVQLKPLVDELAKLQNKLSDQRVKKSKCVESYKRTLKDSVDAIRKLDKLSKQASAGKGIERAMEYAQACRGVLKRFSKKAAKRKVKDLENEFIRSFHQLARKEDVQIKAQINPDNFSVKLLNEAGRSIDKKRLSAGEKQIYAIAILEALARTSGRKLPIIIDTPLARLDSMHRANLVNNYFPRASHQVIILSTDTEVDEEFYAELSPYISHAYKLNYDPDKSSTMPSEGYFWKTDLREIA